MTKLPLTVAAIATFLWAQPGVAGPCAPALGEAQAQVDKRIEATAVAGATGKQSIGAQLSHQPTPGSVAAAEQRLGEGASLEPALAALSRAREADAAGDKAGCDNALAEVRRLIGP